MAEIGMGTTAWAIDGNHYRYQKIGGPCFAVAQLNPKDGAVTSVRETQERQV